MDYACAGGARGRLGAPSVSHSGKSGRRRTIWRDLACGRGAGDRPVDVATAPATNWQSAQLSSWWTRGQRGVPWSSMWGRAAAVTASPAADASMTLTTPGKTACASAAMKIQPRTNRVTLLPTLSFPLVENTEQCNPIMLQGQMSPGSRTQLVRCCILTREYAG